MDLKELRARLAAIQKRMNEINEAAKKESRALKAEEREEWDKLSSEFKDVRAKLLDAEERAKTIGEVNGFANSSQDKPEKPDSESRNNPGAGAEYRNFGEFLSDVRFRPQVLEQREMSMGTGSEGGYLVPPQFLDTLLMVKPEDAIMRPRCFVVPAGDVAPDAELNIPALSQGKNGVFGGVQVVWTEEGAQMSETDGELENVKVAPQEVTAYVTVTDKLLRNAPVASVVIGNLLKGALVNAEDYAFLRGDGVGKPLGILNCPGVKIVSRNTASHINTADAMNMLAALLPESQGFAFWVASQSIMTEILSLKDANKNNIYIQGDITKGIPNTLFGRPIFWTGKTPTLGKKGDLMLIDGRYYMVKDGSGPVVAASPHVEFKSNKTVIKIVRGVDGQGWVKEPLTLEDKSTQVSPYVLLAA